MATSEYHIKDAQARATTDLTNYSGIIDSAVSDVILTAQVDVWPDYYRVTTTNKITKTEAQQIGRIIAKSALGQYTTTYIYNNGNGRANQLFVSKK